MTIARYDFEDEFQEKLAALTLRDVDFNARTDGLVKPDYFTNSALAKLVDIHLGYWEKYRATASTAALLRLVQNAIASGSIPKGMVDDVKLAIKSAITADLSDKEFMIDTVADFARHQAMLIAMTKSLPMLEKGDFAAVEKEWSGALMVGALEEGYVSDVFGEIEARTKRRTDTASGVITRRSVTTGVLKLDECLFHRGWGRRELSSLMAGAKRGKSFGLVFFAIQAAKAGDNVLHITLENSLEVTENRVDAYISQTKTDALEANAVRVGAMVAAFAKVSGVYKLHQYQASTFKPKDLRRLIESYRAKGIAFDLVVVDYADLMQPDAKARDDKIEDSKSVYQGLRDIAVEYDCALLTATQTNREGFKAHVASADHVAEDFNRIRLCDLVISINRDDEEKARGECRLYFAAGRNQEDGYVITVRQDLSTATFVDRVLAVGKTS